jgi:hypothetical protein
VPTLHADAAAYPYASIEDLIIVCGHAVYLASDYLKAGEEDSWFLEDYQKRKGQGWALFATLLLCVKTRFS